MADVTKTTNWTAKDVAKAIYGTKNEHLWIWERTIVEALSGKVDLQTVLTVVRAAHDAH